MVLVADRVHLSSQAISALFTGSMTTKAIASDSGLTDLGEGDWSVLALRESTSLRDPRCLECVVDRAR
jgi:hypothetical protein